jgi:hypothetical protein
MLDQVGVVAELVDLVLAEQPAPEELQRLLGPLEERRQQVRAGFGAGFGAVDS